MSIYSSFVVFVRFPQLGCVVLEGTLSYWVSRSVYMGSSLGIMRVDVLFEC